MGKIQQLPQSLISKIAAGEVIERPVYAVKELVENALDAGADSIKVIVEDSGLKRITVIDNGEGMILDDMQESFKPHTTSKLTSEEQLHQIHTLGFRGEALSSIAAISKMTIASRPKGASCGNSIQLLEGAVEKVSPIGIPAGTQITVENLFYPVPARRKFLKSRRTEFRHILDAMTNFAFSHPQVHFMLSHNGKTIFDLPKVSSSLDRIESLLGKDIYASLIPVDFADGYISVSGFLTKPQVTTKTPHKQFLFINARKVTDRGISLSVKNAYGTLLEKQSYPICLLYFSMPHDHVDVNVHPRKEEVRFVDTAGVLDIVHKAVSQTLTKNNLSFNTNSWKRAVFFGDADSTFTGRSTESYAGKLLKETELPWKLIQTIKTDPSQVMQMHNLFLVTSTANGMVLVDQHAAHERILYEQLYKAFIDQEKALDIHIFVKPKLIELTLSDTELLEEYLEDFAQLGFGIEHFKGKSFLIRYVPKLLIDRDLQELLSDILENLRIDMSAELDSYSRKMIAFLACRSAVKAGDSLTKVQCKDLLEQLEKTPNNATCPHGRPTKVLIGMDMLHKMFKR